MRKRETEGTSLSFLDVVACAFGAIVLLVLILPVGSYGLFAESEPQSVDYAHLFRAKRSLDVEIDQLKSQIETNERILRELGSDQSTTTSRISNLRSAIRATQQEIDTQREQTATTEQEYRRIMAAQARPLRASRPDYAGIPVDADYVALVIDTSSSMKSIWSDVMREVRGVLSLYPDLKGFQIVSDLGVYLYESHEGRWIRDSPARRSDALARLGGWEAPSRSSPARGIKTAISDLYKQDETMALFIVGDDFSGREDLDTYLQEVDEIVADASVKEGSLRIHAIGFANPRMVYSSLRFSVLMRELTQRHAGAFLALPKT